jgi:hypothetical protein
MQFCRGQACRIEICQIGDYTLSHSYSGTGDMRGSTYNRGSTYKR